MLEKLRRLLASPRAPWIAALISVLLLAPAISSGLYMDDLTHRASFQSAFRGSGGMMGDWDLFRFQGPDQAYFKRNLDLGLWPWWIAPGFRLAFFRPISSLSHALDYKLWPDSPWIMHVESIALFAAMALFAGLFYRRHVKPAWAAGLAALFFACDDAHSMVVSWIANRNAVFAGVFGFAALLAHDHARRGSRRAAILAPALFALGLLSGEAALGIAGYLAAYAAFLDDAPAASRVRSLAPYACVGLAWLAVYKGLGYGARGSGMYLDPASEPLAFGRALLERLPLLLAGQLGLPPVDAWSVLPTQRLAPIAAVVSLFLIALGVLLYRAVKADRAARFFAAGMLLSLVPVSATWPSDRLLLFAGLGGFGLIAIFLGKAGEAAGRAERVIAKLVAVAFFVLHGVLAPALLPIRCVMLGIGFRTYVERADASLPAGPELARRTLVVLNAPDVLVTAYVYANRGYFGGVLPKNVRQLAIVHRGTAEVSRVDAHTLAITESEGFFHDMWSLVFRGHGDRYQVGDIVEVSGMRVEIAEVLADGRPRRVLFRFDDPLDSDSMVWVRWEGTAFVPAAPPAVGEVNLLQPIEYMKMMAGSN